MVTPRINPLTLELMRKVGIPTDTDEPEVVPDPDTDQAEVAPDPDTVAVACPYCMTMIDDGIKGKGLEENVQALDVMELVADNMR